MKYWTMPLSERIHNNVCTELDCQTFAFSCREIRLFVWLLTTLASCNSSSVLKLRLGILVSTLWCVACWCTPMTGSLLAGSTHAVGCNMKSECRGTYFVEELIRASDVVLRTPWGKDTKHSLLQWRHPNWNSSLFVAGIQRKVAWSIPTKTHRAAGPQTLQRYVSLARTRWWLELPPQTLQRNVSLHSAHTID